MGWHKLAHPIEETIDSRACKCGKGDVFTISVIEEESEFPPFERGYTYKSTNCPDNCEQI